ncbi:MAG: hypothetical protein WDW38_008181 [Sanguina aurantia]
MLENECGTRYLEALGVRPCKATLDMVSKNMPLTEACVKVTLRSKGHVVDELRLSMPPICHLVKVASVVSAQHVLQLGLPNQVMGAAGPTSPLLTSHASPAQVAPGTPVTTPTSTFTSIAKPYLHPFNIDLPTATASLLAAVAQQRAAAEAAPPSGGRTMLAAAEAAAKPQGPPRGATGPGPPIQNIELLEELVQTLLVTPEVVLALQSQLEGALVGWFKAQAPEMLKGRVSPAEFQATVDLLSAEPTLKLTITLANFLHEEFIHNAPNYPHNVGAIIRSSQPATNGRMKRDPLSPSTTSGGAPTSMVRSSRAPSNSSRVMHAPSPPARSSVVPASTADVLRNLQRYDIGYGLYVKAKMERTEREALSGGAPGVSHGASPATGVVTSSRSSSSSLAPPPPHMRAQLPEASLSGARVLALGGVSFADTASSRPTLEPSSPFTRNPNPNPNPPLTRLNLPSGLSSAAASAASSLFAHGHARPSSRRTGSQSSSMADRGRANPRRGGVVWGDDEVAPHHPSGLDRDGSRGSTTDPYNSHHHSGSGGGGNPSRGASPNPPHPHPRSRSLSRQPTPTHNDDAEAGIAAAAADRLGRVRRALCNSAQMSVAAIASSARAIHSGLGPEDMGQLQQRRLLTVHKEWAALFKTHRQTRAGMFFTLPVLLLSMRLLVHTLFTSLFPCWMKTPDGKAALSAMESTVVQLCDPHGYLQRNLSMMQSTPEAVSHVARHPQKSHTAERAHFDDVSPIMAASMTDPASAAPTAAVQAGAVLHTQLPLDHRAQLFQSSLLQVQARDPDLRATGDPELSSRLHWAGQGACDVHFIVIWMCTKNA